MSKSRMARLGHAWARAWLCSAGPAQATSYLYRAQPGDAGLCRPLDDLKLVGAVGLRPAPAVPARRAIDATLRRPAEHARVRPGEGVRLAIDGHLKGGVPEQSTQARQQPGVPRRARARRIKRLVREDDAGRGPARLLVQLLERVG